MARRNKAKEEVAKVSKPENVTSNKKTEEDFSKEAIEEMKKFPEAPLVEDYENSELNKQAVEAVAEQVADTPEEQPEQEQPTEEPVKLHILADDRLNSLIAKANELGITDVIQIISSDKYGQFYMVYRA